MVGRQMQSRGASGGDGHRQNGHRQLARGLGWFSLGLGMAELAAPQMVARGMGLADDDSTSSWLRAMGVREIAVGLGVLTSKEPQGWMWGRVAGDAMDLALIGAAVAADGVDPVRVAGSTALVAGVTALDVVCGMGLSRPRGQEPGESAARPQLRQSVTIDRPVAEVYRFWRELPNLADVLSNLDVVDPIDERRSYWRAKGPAGMTVEWEAEITEDRPNEMIAWRTRSGSDVHHAGTVRFEALPRDRGTILRVEMDYAPPGGPLGRGLARVTGRDPARQMRADLRVLKQILETGEVTQSDASIHPGMHPARPTEAGRHIAT